MTRERHAAVFSERGELGLPWENAEVTDRWSNFWSSYVRDDEALRTGALPADSAWERVVPFRHLAEATITGPASAEADVFVYPSAIAVIIRVAAEGEWPLDRLADELASIRDSKSWTLTTSGDPSRDRSLEGIADDLQERASTLLTDGTPPKAGKRTVVTVAAPLAARGDGAALALTRDAAKSCLAGLAVLGPPGPLEDARLLPSNTNTTRAGRVYVLTDGHAIWHPTYILDETLRAKVECLYRNHADLVTHIAALASIVAWASDATVPVPVQGLVERAAFRLLQLYEGDRQKTYRSGVAEARIAPIQSKLPALANT